MYYDCLDKSRGMYNITRDEMDDKKSETRREENCGEFAAFYLSLLWWL